MKAGNLWCSLGVVIFFAMVSVCVAYPANDEVSVAIEKTFDFGLRIDHTITARDRQHTVVMIFSQLRHSEGSDRIAESYLSYRPQVEEKQRPFDKDVMRVFVTHIVQALHRTFGKDLKLVSLSASGFLNDAAIQEKNLLAFTAYKPWQDYLNPAKSKQYSQYAAHLMVVNRWKQTGVYDQVTSIFDSVGYSAQLSGFEKLFVQRADKFGCYAQADSNPVNPGDRYPYPGMIHFSIRKLE